MVDFIVERVENVLVVPNASLRYQPASLSAQQISDMVFLASLENMDDEQKQTAVKAREASSQMQDQRPAGQNSNAGITNIMMGQGNGPRMMGGRQPGGAQGQGQGRGAPAVVMRNLWYLNADGKLDVMQVRTGVSDGSFTEIFLDEEFEGRQIILRERV
jgi:hypothetical protein